MSKIFFSTVALSATVALTCGGCASYSKMEPGKTLGEIQVSGVRVSSRERMVNERLKRREFLENQLQVATQLKDADFANQGGVSIRSISGIAAGGGISLDAGMAKVARQRDIQRLRNQVEIDKKDQELLLAMREQLLAGVKDKSISPSAAKEIIQAIKPDGAENSTGSGSPLPDPAAVDKWRKEIDSLLDSVAQVPKTIDPPGATTSQIDLFRDKLALLEEIRSELAASELDDRHDLYGGTLIRLSVDATLIPDDDTGAWGVVEMLVKPIFEPDLFTPKGFVERLNDLAIDRMIRAKRQYVKACYQHNEGSDQNRTVMNMLSRFAFIERKIAVSRSYRVNGPRTSSLPHMTKITSLLKDAMLEIRKTRETTDSQLLCNPSFEKDYLIPLVEGAFHSEIYATSMSLPSHNRTSGNGSIDLYKVLEMKQGLSADNSNQFELALLQTSTELATWLNEASTALKMLPYSYAATPKEQVQRIGQSGTRRDAIELILALQATSGAGSASGAISMMQANEVIMSALHRQPLVVGYSRTPIHGEEHRSVGWVLGPRFKIEQDWRGRPEFGFRHRMVQNTLNAEIVVPLLASGLEVTMCGGWRASTDLRASASPSDNCPAGTRVIGREIVPLPQTVEAIAETFDPSARQPLPELYARNLIPQLATSIAGAADETKGSGRSTLLLQGANLWRNPQVFIGSVKASEVAVLSDMRGIVATFNVPPSSLPDCTSDRTVTVITSTGSVDFAQSGKACPNIPDKAVPGKSAGTVQKTLDQ